MENTQAARNFAPKFDFELKSSLYRHWKDHTLEPLLDKVWFLPHPAGLTYAKEDVPKELEQAVDAWIELANRNGVGDETPT